MKLLCFAAIPLLALAACHSHAQTGRPGSTVAKIRGAHELACGVVQEDAEYSTEEDHSSRGGFDSALCQAFALAVDAHAAVKVTSFLDEESAADALRKGTLDVVATMSADESHREADSRRANVRYTRAVFYDSLALLAPVSSSVMQPAGLTGKKICVLAETGAEEALHAWFAQRRIDYLPFPFQEEGEMEAAYISNNCAALAAERTRLSLIRLSLGGSAVRHSILPDALSRDPMAAATRMDDAQWSRIVDLVAATLLLAEELGITSTSAESAGQGSIARLNHARDLGTGLGLRSTWISDVLRTTGNYGQMFERTLGSGSDRQLSRGLNRLHRDGGLLTAAPLDALPK